MRWLRVPLIIVGIIATGYGWIVTDERFGRPERPLRFEEFHLSPPPRFHDELSATFTICDGPMRANCVVDGDTFWFRGGRRNLIVSTGHHASVTLEVKPKRALPAGGSAVPLLRLDCAPGLVVGTWADIICEQRR